MRPASQRDLLSADALTVTDVAAILRATATPDGQFDPHVVRLAQELERLQWELQGWQGRCQMAREERDALTSQLYVLRLTKVPGGKI